MIPLLPKVLVVDDEPDTLRLVRRILQEDGYQVEQARDGEEAIEQFRSWKPDLVLLDIILPRHDGLSVLRQIREIDASTGIIMLSALNSDQLTTEAVLAGADDYLSKPFQLREIRARIHQVLEKTRLRRENESLRKQLEAVKGQSEGVSGEHISTSEVRQPPTSHGGLASEGGSSSAAKPSTVADGSDAQ